MGNYKNILRTRNFVAGNWSESNSEGDLEVMDKYSQEPMATIPMGSADDFEAAILGAQRSMPALREMGAEGRAAGLEKLADLLEEKREDFVDMIVREAGKPIGYARGEVNRCLVTLRTAAAEALRLGGEVVPIDYGAGKGRTAFTKRFPVGIIGAITPFNFPLNLALHKIAPALAVGCPIIVKPSPHTPLVLMAFAALVAEAGWPEGTLSAIISHIGPAEVLVHDPRIALLTFTGSDTVGWKLKGEAGKKKVMLELGGNASVVVDSSADLAYAAKRVAIGSFLYAGQICISTQRVFVVEDVFEEFKQLLIPEIEALRVGDPHDPEVMVGPLIDGGAYARIGQWVEDAVKDGAEILCGGTVENSGRHIYKPTLMTNVRSDMDLYCKEVFGPIAVIEAVPDFATGLDKVNDSIYGLQAGVFTDRIEHLKMAHETLEVGGILINDIPGFRVDSMPYGGIKDSGLGREGLKYAMEEMTEPRLLIY